MNRSARYGLEDPVEALKGIGPRWAAELGERGVHAVGDLLAHLPFRYEDRRRVLPLSQAREGHPLTAIGVIRQTEISRTQRRGIEKFTVLIDDSTAAMRVLFFNRSYLSDLLQVGRRLLVYGTPKRVRRGVELHGPEFDLLGEDEEPARHLGWIPVYERLGPLSPRRIRRVIGEALDGLEPIPDPLPSALRRREGLLHRDAALRGVHRPPDEVEAALLESRRGPAHRRLAFDDFFFLELGLALSRHQRRAERRVGGYRITDLLRQRLAALLPFRLTAAQKRVLKEIGEDLEAPWPMNRLLLGDVGSGKTVVAALAMMVAHDNGYQSAIMAPTEILARQHGASLGRLLAPAGVEVELLTAGLPGPDQRRVRERLERGECRIVVGTHSLISEKVRFARLGMAVIDEQHRFGVVQRADLVAKGEHPDVLVMSATPIPRTLAMVIYGDLDVSVIDEKPPGRLPIRTVVREASQRERVFGGIERALAEGRQIYVVRPAVEQASGMKAAEEGLEEYRRRFPGARVAMVHGRMPAEQRQESLRAFTEGEASILVATTVIEVGIDVAQASVIVVEDADRFGLAQLHQLRGRVGRGDQRSYCVLIASEDAEERALERLRVLASTDDGFLVAEKDLELRGPGEMAGTSQSGYPSFRVADIVRHRDLLLDARRAAFELVEVEGPAGLTRDLVQEALERHGKRLRLAGIG